MIAEAGAHSCRTEDTVQERSRERRESAQFITIITWVLGSDPDPTYDPVHGWKLDQFAMAFEPELVREYKRVSKAEYPTPLPTEPFAPSNPIEKIEIKGKLSGKIGRRLLIPRFEVRGCPLGENAPIVIHKALLEPVIFDIETSELRELCAPPETARRFDHVRVFDLAGATKPSGGRKPTYDWQRLTEQLEREKPDLSNRAALVAYCRDNVAVMPGKRAGKGGADGKTIDGAISKHGLEKFIKST
jgi:hypothetical protein